MRPQIKERSLAPALEQAVTALPGAGRSPWQDARRRFSRNRAALVSVVVLILITLACIIGPML